MRKHNLSCAQYFKFESLWDYEQYTVFFSFLLFLFISFLLFLCVSLMGLSSIPGLVSTYGFLPMKVIILMNEGAFSRYP